MTYCKICIVKSVAEGDVMNPIKEAQKQYFIKSKAFL